MRASIRLLLVGLVVVLIGAACSSSDSDVDADADAAGSTSVPTTTTTTPETNEEESSVTDETGIITGQGGTLVPGSPLGESATAIIGSTGGEVIATAGGIEVRLNVPEGALFSPEEISMTVIDPGDDPGADEVIALVSLEPEGLSFVRSATLQVSGVDVPDDAVAIAADGDGANVHLAGLVEAGSISVSHFSLHGVAESEVATVLENYQPQSAATAAAQSLTLAESQGDGTLAVRLLGAWAADLRASINEFPSRGVGFHDQYTADLIYWIDAAVNWRPALSPDGAALLDGYSEDLTGAWGAWLISQAGEHRLRCLPNELHEGLAALRWELIAETMWIQLENAQMPNLGFREDITGVLEIIEPCLEVSIEITWEVDGEHIDYGDGPATLKALMKAEGVTGVRDFNGWVDNPGDLVLSGVDPTASLIVTDLHLRPVSSSCLVERAPGTVKLVWLVGGDQNLSRLDEAEDAFYVAAFQMVDPPSSTCLGIELAHLPINATMEANRRRMRDDPRAGVAPTDGTVIVPLDPASDAIAVSEIEMELGDLFGPSWTIVQTVRLTTNG